MSKSLKIALAIQVLIMLSVLIPPVITKATGTEVFLETERVDPRALFRGDYVILSYPIGRDVSKELAKKALESGDLVYVTVSLDKPAKFISASTEKPNLDRGQACLVARVDESMRWNEEVSLSFPQISQFFVPEGTGRGIESDLNTMAAKIATTKSCNAVLLNLDYL
jgi:uncharacterized membrane-anchored protein